ncbi:hypothetical protein HPB51_000930 [Rhipicephalus microplus]|uniref:Uncharacterized protein n=1 Tax=Rhipicephalus microplus TaxID=6941 RepID=A0A9J6DL07_RHIMP|nr:hypothetical protein HPB51_000930 [Rhipicephalus microplus]
MTSRRRVATNTKGKDRGDMGDKVEDIFASLHRQDRVLGVIATTADGAVIKSTLEYAEETTRYAQMAAGICREANDSGTGPRPSFFKMKSGDPSAGGSRRPVPQHWSETRHEARPDVLDEIDDSLRGHTPDRGGLVAHRSEIFPSVTRCNANTGLDNFAVRVHDAICFRIGHTFEPGSHPETLF